MSYCVRLLVLGLLGLLVRLVLFGRPNGPEGCEYPSWSGGGCKNELTVPFNVPAAPVTACVPLLNAPVTPPQRLFAPPNTVSNPPCGPLTADEEELDVGSLCSLIENGGALSTVAYATEADEVCPLPLTGAEDA